MKTIYLAEIADNQNWVNFFPVYSQTYALQFNNDYSSIAATEFELENIGFSTTFTMLSFSVLGNPYQQAHELQDVIRADDRGVYYFDEDTQMLYVHFKDHGSPHEYSLTEIEIGFLWGVFNTNSEWGGVLNGMQYQPRLIGSPNLTEKKDDIFNQKQVFAANKIELDNADMAFKNYTIGANVRPKIGGFARSKIWTGDDVTDLTSGDFTSVSVGAVEKVEEGESLVLHLRDIRKTLNKKLATRIIDNTNYPFINDESVYTIPQVWGKCQRVPLQCLNEKVNDEELEKTTPNPLLLKDYVFMCYDIQDKDFLANTLGSVYIDDKRISPGTTIGTDSISNIATLTLQWEEFCPIDPEDGTTPMDPEGLEKVNATLTGMTATATATDYNGMRFIRQMLNEVYEINYNSTFYDLDTWEKYQADSYNVGIYIDKPTELYKIIQLIASANLGKFVWNADRLFSWSNDDYETTDAVITKEEIFPLDYVFNFSQEISQTLSNFRVGHSRNLFGKKNVYSKNDTNEDYAFATYKFPVSKDFDTVLTDSADITDFETRILEEFGESKDTFVVSVPWEYYNLEAGNYISIEADMPNYTWAGNVLCQILNKTPDVVNHKVKLTLRIKSYL